MQDIRIPATLEEQIGKKGPYIRVVIELTPETKKIVFLEPAETQLVKMYYSED